MGHAVTQGDFEHCTPFNSKCITKLDGTTVDAAEDNLVMSMYNFLEESSN